MEKICTFYNKCNMKNKVVLVSVLVWRRKMKKKITNIVTAILAIIIVPYLFVETNTLLFGKDFKEEYKQTHMISGVQYYKVFYYTGKTAKVYYVDSTPRAGHFVWFKKKDGEWNMETWETVWSDWGSASGVTFPFYR